MVAKKNTFKLEQEGVDEATTPTSRAPLKEHPHAHKHTQNHARNHTATQTTNTTHTTAP
jgi:hypothetical protein